MKLLSPPPPFYFLTVFGVVQFPVIFWENFPFLLQLSILYFALGIVPPFSSITCTKLFTLPVMQVIHIMKFQNVMYGM